MEQKKETRATKVAFIGLGVMGYPMAGYLKKAGCDVTVYNRTTAKAEKWVKEFGGSLALTPREAAKDCEVVFTCVGNDDDLRSVVLGENGAFAGMRPGAVLWDDTTASANVARELYAKAKELGLNFVDAPVSGGQAGADNGVLTVMCGGDANIIEQCRPVAMAFSCSIVRIGDSGCGQLAKMCNQISMAGVLQGLAEAIAFAKCAGLNIELLIDAIGKGSASSWQMLNRYKTMDQEKFDFGFAVNWLRKDLGFCLDEARRNGADLPVIALIDQFYSDVQNMGGGRWDTSSLIMRLNTKPRK